MKLSQKGQSMIEFSVIFPFFMFMIMCLAYFGLAFADYLQLNSIASNSAREAIAVDKTKFGDIKEKYYKQSLISNIYKWGDASSKFDITFDEGNKNVIVKIEAPLDTDEKGLLKTIDRLTNFNNNGAFDIKIEYTMYKE